MAKRSSAPPHVGRARLVRYDSCIIRRKRDNYRDFGRMSNAPETDTANVIKTLWHGTPLSIFEELSLLSFVRQGHEVELYSYEDVAVPDGVRLVDANSIMREADVFAYTSGPAKGSFAAFSNLFRFKMLAEHGGIWSDADVLCIRPFFDLPAASIGQVCKFTPEYLNTAILKFPIGNAVCVDVYEHLADEGSNISLGASSELLTQAANRHRDDRELLPVDAFYPLTWKETSLLVDPDQYEKCSSMLASSYAVHWWNTAITFGLGMPKEALPSRGSYLHTKAIEVFGNDTFPAWPISVSRVWIDHFNHVSNTIGDIFVGTNVIGRVETTKWDGGGEVEVSGWAFDQTRPLDPLTVLFLLDGEVVHTQRTTAGRPDVTDAYGAYRPRYVSFAGKVKTGIEPKAQRGFMDRIFKRPDQGGELVVMAIGASGSASVIAKVKRAS